MTGLVDGVVEETKRRIRVDEKDRVVPPEKD